MSAPNVEAPGEVGTGRAQEQANTNNGDCAGTAGDKQADKTFATLRARLALAGYTLTRTDARDCPARYSVLRWNMARELPDLVAVDAFAVRVGVAA